MIVDEEVYLKHFGVKGMRWGQRKSTSSNTDSKDKSHKNLKRGAAVIAIGAAAAAVMIAKNGNAKMSDLKKVDPMPFKVSGKNFKIEAATGEALDTAVKAILENRRGR
jgi:Ni,Fe-hydrogenase III small subunit